MTPTTPPELFRPYHAHTLKELSALSPELEGAPLILCLDELVTKAKASEVEPAWAALQLVKEVEDFGLRRLSMDVLERSESLEDRFVEAAEQMAGILRFAPVGSPDAYVVALQLEAGEWLRLEVIRKPAFQTFPGPTYSNIGLALSSRSGRPAEHGAPRSVQWHTRMTEEETAAILDVLEDGETRSDFTRKGLLLEFKARGGEA